MNLRPYIKANALELGYLSALAAAVLYDLDTVYVSQIVTPFLLVLGGLLTWGQIFFFLFYFPYKLGSFGFLIGLVLGVLAIKAEYEIYLLLPSIDLTFSTLNPAIKVFIIFASYFCMRLIMEKNKREKKSSMAFDLFVVFWFFMSISVGLFFLGFEGIPAFDDPAYWYPKYYT